MKISLIVAMDEQGVIGNKGGLPWRLPADLQHFKALTMGKPIVMGRKTHEAIGRPLPGRENIVISRRKNYQAAGCTVLAGLDEVYIHCAGAQEIMIMGGAELYRQTLDLADRLYLTEVHVVVTGDVLFPAFNRNEWQEIERQDYESDDNNEYPFSFVILEPVTKSEKDQF